MSRMADIASRRVNHLDREPGQAAEVIVAGFQIEKGIPMPADRRLSQKIGAVMAVLDVGDSFRLPNQSAKSSAYAAAKKLAPKRFVIGERDGGLRVWRTE